MGDIGRISIVQCFICDRKTILSQSFEIFSHYLPDTDVLLSDSLVECLLLRKLTSDSLRSSFLCLNCHACLGDVYKNQKALNQIKNELWNVFKSTCERYGDDPLLYVNSVETQTDSSLFQNEYSEDLNVSSASLQCDGDENSSLNVGSMLENVKESEEITVEANPDDIEPRPDEKGLKYKKNKRNDSCIVCGRMFGSNSEMDNHMLTHSIEERDKASKARLEPCKTKSVRKPAEREQEPYICKYCGKSLPTKVGAIRHASRVHKSRLDFLKTQPSNVPKHNIKFEEEEDLSDLDDDRVLLDNYGSSSEDEVPLARRRKEFIFEKIKQEVITDKPQKQGLTKQRKTNQKLAFQNLKKSGEISITKVSTKNYKKNQKNLRFKRENLINDIDLVVQNIENKEIRSKIADLSKTQEVTIQNKNLETMTPPSDEEKTKSQSSAIKNKPKKYSLSTLLKLKKQKEAGLFLPVIKEAKYECDVCKKMWKTRGELNAHKGTHSDARPYICEICGQAYKHKTALDVHVGMHKGIFQHQCPYCQKAFTQKGALQRHLPIHTGEMPFQCELCGKRFVHRTSFGIHSMAHTGVRNIRCKVCNLGVLSKSHLRRHMRIHTGERPYECGTCGKAFAERYNLVAHQRIHDPNQLGPARQHKKRVLSCRLCNTTFDRRHKLEVHMITTHNKVVEDPPQRSIFDADGFVGTSVAAGMRQVEPIIEVSGNREFRQETIEIRKADIMTEEDPKIEMDSPHNDRHINMKNWEILRNIDNARNNLEFVRMSNGEEGIRMAPGTTWYPSNTNAI